MNRLKDFLSAWLSDWTTLMSGAASVVFTFWATFWPPTVERARIVLLITAALCFVCGAYRIWSRERRKSEELEAALIKLDDPVRQEFQEIQAAIFAAFITTDISSELARLRAFLLRHPGLFAHKDFQAFYERWIKPHEYELRFNSTLPLKQAGYDALRVDLIKLNF